MPPEFDEGEEGLLCDRIRSTLEQQGVLAKIKAELRSAVVQVLQNEKIMTERGLQNSLEFHLGAALCLDFLAKFKMLHTRTVFWTEAHAILHSDEVARSEDLIREWIGNSVNCDSLLYQMIGYVKRQNQATPDVMEAQKYMPTKETSMTVMDTEVALASPTLNVETIDMKAYEELSILDAKIKEMEADDETGDLLKIGAAINAKDNEQLGDADPYGSDFEESVDEAIDDSDSLSEEETRNEGTVEMSYHLRNSENSRLQKETLEVLSQITMDTTVDSQDALNSYDYIEVVENMESAQK